jgi:molecular chaperone Hsp33
MIRAQTDDDDLNARLRSLYPDGITVFTLGGGRVRGALLHGTAMINQMRANHGLGSLETLVLGQAFLGAALMGSMLKEGDRIILRVEGDGPAEGLSAEAWAEGAVRGRLYRSPIGQGGLSADGVGSALFGSGYLSVTRFSSGSPQSFVGSVALKSGSLAQELASYYLESEQTRTAFVLDIEFDEGGRAIGAGALFFQALPGADDEFLGRVEDRLAALPALGAYFAAGGQRDAFLQAELRDLFPEVLGQKGAAFDCPCSRERFSSFFASAQGDLLADLAGRGPWPVETICHNCGSAYYFSKEELEAMLRAQRARRDGSETVD